MQDRYVSRAGVGQPRQTRVHQSPHHLPGENRNKGRCAALRRVVKHFFWQYLFANVMARVVLPVRGVLPRRKASYVTFFARIPSLPL